MLCGCHVVCHRRRFVQHHCHRDPELSHHHEDPFVLPLGVNPAPNPWGPLTCSMSLVLASLECLNGIIQHMTCVVGSSTWHNAFEVHPAVVYHSFVPVS